MITNGALVMPLFIALIASKKINSAANAVTVPSGSLMKSNPENEMAAKIILKFCRQVYACKEFQKRKAEKEEYNNLMEKLEKEVKSI